jgi:hypothetical protein
MTLETFGLNVRTLLYDHIYLYNIILIIHISQYTDESGSSPYSARIPMGFPFDCGT